VGASAPIHILDGREGKAPVENATVEESCMNTSAATRTRHIIVVCGHFSLPAIAHRGLVYYAMLNLFLI
jgi:hypothetical protein